MTGKWWTKAEGSLAEKGFSKNKVRSCRVWELVCSIRTLVGAVLGPVLLLGLLSFPGNPAVLEGRVKGWTAVLLSAASTVLEAIAAGGCLALVGGFWEASLAVTLYFFLLVGFGWPKSLGWGLFVCWWLAFSAMTLGVHAGVRRVGRGLVVRWPRVGRVLMASRAAVLFVIGLLNAFLWSAGLGPMADLYFVSCMEDLPPSLDQWAKLVYAMGPFVRAVFWGDEEFFLLALIGLPFFLGFRLWLKAVGKHHLGWRFAVVLVAAFAFWYVRDVRFASWRFQGDRAHISAGLLKWSASGREPGYYAAAFERPAAWYALYGGTVTAGALLLLGWPFGFGCRGRSGSAGAVGEPSASEGRAGEAP
jgi:hypothetical protein